MGGFGSKIKGFFGIDKKKEKQADASAAQDLTQAQEEQQRKADEQRLRNITEGLRSTVDTVAGYGKSEDRVKLDQMERLYMQFTSEANSLRVDDKEDFDSACTLFGEEIMKARERVDAAELADIKEEYGKISVEMRGLGMKQSEGGRHKKMADAAARLDQLDARRKELGKGDDAELNKLSRTARDRIGTASGRVEDRENAMVNSFMVNSKAEILKMGKAEDEQRLNMLEEILNNMSKSKDFNKSERDRTAEYRKLIKDARGRIQADKDGRERNKILNALRDLKRKFDHVTTIDHQLYLDMALGAWLVEEGNACKLGANMTSEVEQALKDTRVARDSAVKRMEEEKVRIRKEKKVNEWKEIILKQKGTPLETLIAKTVGMNLNAEIPEGHKEDAALIGSEAEKKTKWGSAKENMGKLRERTESYFKSELWEDFAEEFRSKADSTANIFSNVTGAIADAGDYADAKKLSGDFALGGKQAFKGSGGKFSDKDANSVIGSVASVLSAGLHLISLVKSSVQMFKEEHTGDADPKVDGQERWNKARDMLHQIVDIFGDALGLADGFISVIPLLKPTLAIIKDGLSMVVDFADLFTNSTHIEQMRRQRNRIYERIQKKKEKYSSGAKKDTAAAEAYDVKKQWFQFRSDVVDDKRKDMMKTVALANQGQPDEIRIVQGADLRSRNDSRYREAQYGLGQRIVQMKASGADKSKIRQMEALEMMEQYRETDKAHKKMVKALLHNLESIIKGGVAITSSGLKIVGQLASLTGVGAVAGGAAYGSAVALDVASAGYELTRNAVSSAYGGIRKLVGTEANKETTRTDMALSMMYKMQEITESSVWENRKFKESAGLDLAQPKDVIREGRNVEHLRSILRDGLDARVSSLIASQNAGELKEKIAASFGQD
ncbi:MAG: hypothetical protein KH452_11980 [Clostridiales bacterium]|nr:hypothetical protein [Clostridiales bacterium]